MLHILQILTVIFGSCTVLLSVYLAYRFFIARHSLGFALGLMLAAEACMGGFTLWFSASAAIDGFTSIPPAQEMLMRWGIFGVAAATSIHLFITMKRLEE